MRKGLCILAALCAVVFCAAASGSSEGSSGNSGQQTYVNSIGMEFVLIPAGSFPIVTAWDENDEASCVSKALVSKAFYLGKYPVTQREWQAVPPSLPAGLPCAALTSRPSPTGWL